MSSLARLSLANRGLVALVALVVTGWGLLTIPSLKQQLFPSLDFPAAVITASYQGAAPEIVERQVTTPIENSIQGIPGLSTVTSTSREGNATIQLEFDFGTDLDETVSKIESALNRIDTQLPEGVDPSVFAGSTDEVPAIILAASSSGDERAFAAKLASAVVPEIQAIDGVREAAVTGVRDQQLVITPNLAKFAAAKLDVTAITTALRANGVSVPAGSLTEGERSLTVQVGTPLATVDDLRDIYLTPTGASAGGSAGATPVKLGDVATVQAQLAPVTSITRTNGRSSLGISVTATPDGNAVGISDEIRDKLPEFTRALGGDAALTVVFDQAPFVQRSIDGLTTEGLLGLGFAVLVILIFLLSVRSTLVTAVSIPLSVVIALIALWGWDYSLNMLTLGALTIAIGRVVDDSIVVLENIKRHLSYGEDRRTAVLGAVREVAGAVTASTLTTVAVFSPIALVGGMVGQLFAPFALTVTAALLASLLVALTVIPVLAYWFLRPAEVGAGQDEDLARVRLAAEERERRGPLQRAYVPIIRFAVRRRLTVLAVGLLIFVATVGLAGTLKTNFFDQSGQNTLSIGQQLPVGTSLAATDAAAKQVEAVLAKTPEVQTYQLTVGGAAGIFGVGGGRANRANYSVTLDEDVDVLAVQSRLRDSLAALTGVGELTVNTGGGDGFSGNQVKVIVQADDEKTLAAAVEQVRGVLADTPNVTDVTSDLQASAPRVEVVVDRAKAARYGLTEASIGQLVAVNFRGSPLGQVTLAGETQNLLLRVGATPATLAQLRALPLVSASGVVPLGTVATVSEVDGPVQVTRIDGARSITVSGTANGSNVGAVTNDLTSKLKAITLPDGATYTIGGVSQDQSEAFGDLILAVLAAIAIVFLIMAATFRSLIQPLILLVSVPFAATGAIALLLITDTALGVPAMIGMLMLIGIVVTNAIVLMDLINQYREQGMGVLEAVIEGGRRRLRPILMTAVATICALLPMSLGLTGSGGFISQPLAVVVIGGLISSTLLTLVLVPTLYTMVEHRRERLRAWRARRRGGPVGTPGASSDAVSSDASSDAVSSGASPDAVSPESVTPDARQGDLIAQ